MRTLFLIGVLTFSLGVADIGLAQTKAPALTKHPNSHAVHKLIRQQMRQIQADLKAGKITESQAKAKRGSLIALHQQEVKFRNQNGGEDLTESQKNQLNSSLGKMGN